MATLTKTKSLVRKARPKFTTNQSNPQPVIAAESQLELDALQRAFAARRALLVGSIEVAQVVEMLGVSRQAVHEREKKGRLLAVRENGRLRFPLWQFDAQGDDGVVAGLPSVLKALDEIAPIPALAKMSWLQKPNGALGGATPLESLRAGQQTLVQSAARGDSAG